MNTFLATVLTIDCPHNEVFLDYLMFNFKKYAENNIGLKTLLMILKQTKCQKFIDNCINYIENSILDPSLSLNATSIMSTLLDLKIKINKLRNLIQIMMQNIKHIFIRSKIHYKPFVKLATLLPDDLLLSLCERLNDKMLDFITCKSRNYLVQELI